MEGQLQRFLRVGRRPTDSPIEPLDLGDLVEELLPLVRPAAAHACVKLDCRISTQQLSVRGDREALSQVMLNLLINAIEAAQHHAIGRQATGRVCIEVGAATDHSAVVVVSDSGAGPTAAVADSLFEPFVTDKAQGSGLGLAVAKEVVVEHGGSIEWRRAGGMTQFRVTLPLLASFCLPAGREEPGNEPFRLSSLNSSGAT
jgi:signal transduction histidine kinase